MTDMNQRVEKLEGVSERVVIILEGEPVLDIKGNRTGTEGGMVRQGEQHTEALDVIDQKLDGIQGVQEQIQEQIQERLSRPGWSKSQIIKASMVIVVALGSISTIVWRL